MNKKHKEIFINLEASEVILDFQSDYILFRKFTYHFSVVFNYKIKIAHSINNKCQYFTNRIKFILQIYLLYFPRNSWFKTILTYGQLCNDIFDAKMCAFIVEQNALIVGHTKPIRSQTKPYYGQSLCVRQLCERTIWPKNAILLLWERFSSKSIHFFYI